MAAVADVAPQRGRRAAGTRAADDPLRHRVRLLGHLLEDRFGDVVVGTPVGGALGVGELVHEVAAGLARQPLRFAVQVAGALYQVAAPALELDGGDLLRGGAGRDHGDERQPQQAGEVGLGHRGRATGRLDHRAALAQPAIGQRVQEQRTREAMLQAAGRVAGLVLQVDVDARKAGQAHRNQVGIGRAVVIGFDLADGRRHPGTLGHGSHTLMKAEADSTADGNGRRRQRRCTPHDGMVRAGFHPAPTCRASCCPCCCACP